MPGDRASGPTASAARADLADLRAGEQLGPLPEAPDAAVYFIGRIRTPWTDRAECPRQGRSDGPECRIEVDPDWVGALAGLEAFSRIQVLYWLDRSRRDLMVQNPRRDGRLFGTFALRSPVRPNPIGVSLVDLVRIEGATVVVRGLDCLDGTPLIDIKPDACSYSPQAAPKPGAHQS